MADTEPVERTTTMTDPLAMSFRMKTTVLLLTILLIISTASAQTPTKLPHVLVTTLEGGQVDVASLSNAGNPMVISLWATWCAPCKQELAAIAEDYGMWQARTGVKVIAISIDDARTTARVGPYVSSQGWEFEIYLDPAGELMRSLPVSSIPCTLLLNGNGEVVWQHKGYMPGDEKELFRKIKEQIGKP
jgi:cytochrome c biogenesis protein CcmG, thiol:disulfide interchange protein DsbE